MKGKIIAISLLGLFLSIASVVDSNAYEIKDYMPLQVGNTWIYTGNYQFSIPGTEVVNGATTFKFQSSPSSYGLFTNDSNGLRLYAGDGEVITPPLTLFGATFDIGDVFSASGAIGAGNSITVIHEILGFEQLSVPAYSGECLKVGVSVNLLNGADYTEEIWLAQGIGLIKVKNHNLTDEGYLWGLDNELLSYNATPALWPLEIGELIIYTRTDNSEYSWTVRLEVLEIVKLGQNEYYHLRKSNYRPGEIEDMYFRSTVDSVYYWNGTEEFLLFKTGPIGTKWTSEDTVTEITAMESVMVPYGGTFNAYVFKKNNPSENSPFWYDYFVPGFGFIKEVDYWTNNAPKIQKLIWKGKIFTQGQLDQAVLNERKKYDPSVDGIISLEEAIHALQIVSGVK